MRSRRKFLQHIGAGLIPFAFGFSPKSLQFTMDNLQDEKTLRVALMGLGSYANRVADAMKDSKRSKVAGVISGTPSKITDWQKRFDIPDKNCYNYENFDAIKDNDDIDAVYIITPNALHHDQCLRVAAAGKHVICEKPMAINAKEGQEMIDACEKAGVKLLIGYRMHFEANTLEIVKMREAGEFGDIKFFQGLCGFKIGDPNQWRLDPELAGGGAMMDIGIYAINGSRYMVGEEPIWVTAQEVKTDPEKFKEGVDETITFQLGFESGVVASCLSTYSMGNLDKFFLNGTEGFAEMQPSTGYGPIRSATHKGRLDLPHVTHQTTQMDEMAKIIYDGKTPKIPVDGKEGLKDMKIIDAIFQAVADGSKVKLDLS